MTRPDIFDYHDYRPFLTAWLEHKKAEREAQGLPTYSHRMFAAAAGLSNVGTLASVISGARHLTPALLQAFRTPLELDPQESRFLELLAERDERVRELDRAKAAAQAVQEEGPAGEKASRRRKALVQERIEALELARREAEDALVGARRMRRAQLTDAARLKATASWSATTLIELSRCAGFRLDPRWISEAMRGAIPPEGVAPVLALLEEAGLLRRAPDGSLIRDDQPLVAPDGIGDAIWKFYEEAAARSLSTIQEARGDGDFARRARLGALTIAIPSEALPRLRDRITELRKDLFQFMEGLQGTPDSVYMAYLHIFPVTEITTEVEDPDDR